MERIPNDSSNDFLNDMRLRLFAAGKIPEDSPVYTAIQADLTANPETGRAALFIQSIKEKSRLELTAQDMINYVSGKCREDIAREIFEQSLIPGTFARQWMKNFGSAASAPFNS